MGLGGEITKGEAMGEEAREKKKQLGCVPESIPPLLSGPF